MARQHGDAIDRTAALAALRHAASIADEPALVGAIAETFADLGELDDAREQIARLKEAPASTAPQVREVARRLLDAGRDADALALLGQAGPLVTGDDDLLLVRALAQAAAGAVDKALADVDCVIARTPALANAHLVRAQLLAGQNRTSECIAAWEMAAGLRPDDPRAATGLGVALASAGRYDEAIDVLFLVVQSHDTASEAYQNLAIVLREARRLDEAEWAARRALELAPGAAQSHYDLGLVLEASERLDDAAQSFREASQRGGVWVRPFLALARVLERAGRVDEAIDTLGRAAALEPRDSEARKEVADALAALRARGGAFAGNLAAFSIWQILEILQNHRSTGRLELALTGTRAEIFVREGGMVRIVSDQMPALADVLREFPDVDPARLVPLARIKGESTYQVALRVWRLGLLDVPTLRRAVESQLQMTLERLVDRTDGTFAFHQGAFERQGTDVELDIRFVLLEIARTRDSG